LGKGRPGEGVRLRQLVMSCRKQNDLAASGRRAARDEQELRDRTAFSGTQKTANCPPSSSCPCGGFCCTGRTTN
jgi:hypothetical protein